MCVDVHSSRDEKAGPGHYVESARDQAALAEANALVDRVYREQLGLDPPPGLASEPDLLAQVSVLLVRNHSGHAVGTLTLQSSGLDCAAVPLPLELEHSYALEPLLHHRCAAREQVAELRRVAVLSGQGQAFARLMTFAVALSERSGIRDWVGLVDAGGGSRFDALLVHHALAAQGVLEEPLPLLPRNGEMLQLRRPVSVFRDALRKVDLPRVRSFAAVLGAHAIGIPSLHPLYGDRVVVPMLAEVERVKQRFGARGRS
jgi:hypothetical protein